jgi:16S rRNA (uracil1498-N3)-methyltransferase
MRLKEGERVAVFDGRGHEATAEVAALTKGRVTLKVLQSANTPRPPADIFLGQAIPKGKNMDIIVEKATELGAVGIIPLISERTIVRLSSDEVRDRREKWERVAIEAAKQCGRNWLPEIRPPLTPKALFDAGEKFDLMLVASLQPDARHLKTVLREMAGDRPMPFGPEDSARARADRTRGRLHPRRDGHGKISRVPADHAWADHPADGNGNDLLSERALARTLRVGLVVRVDLPGPARLAHFPDSAHHRGALARDRYPA